MTGTNRSKQDVEDVLTKYEQLYEASTLISITHRLIAMAAVGIHPAHLQPSIDALHQADAELEVVLEAIHDRIHPRRTKTAAH